MRTDEDSRAGKKAMRSTPKGRKPSIVIATPHARNNGLEMELRKNLPQCRVIRIRDRAELDDQTLRAISPEWIFWLKPWEIQFNSEGVATAGARNKLYDAVNSGLLSFPVP